MKKKIKEKIASLFIPKNTCYCYTPKGILKPSKKHPFGGFKVKPCPYFKWKYNKEWKEKAEYCTYLKDFLSIQDSVKDCGINDYEELDGREEFST